MSTVIVRTILDAPPDAVWQAVTTPAGFRFVTRGLVELDGLDQHAGPFTPGATVVGRLRVLGVPFSRHRISLESIDHDQRSLQSDEGGGPIRSWRHLITVEPVDGDPTQSCYTDRIEIDAGLLTAAITLFAHGFYRLRQRRWRRLAPVLAALRPVDGPDRLTVHAACAAGSARPPGGEQIGAVGEVLHRFADRDAVHAGEVRPHPR